MLVGQFGGVELTVGTGKEFTVTVLFTVTEQPLLSTTVTVYEVVAVGETLRMEFVEPSPQVNVEPPVAVNMASIPTHIVPSLFVKPDWSVTAMAAVGVAFTVIVPTALTVPQPPVNGML